MLGVIPSERSDDPMGENATRMSKSSAAAADLLREGTRCEKAGLIDRALDLYREARQDQEDPSLLAEAWRLEAYAHHAQCDWGAALTAARRSGELARDSHHADLWAEALNAEGAVHLARGELDEASRLFARMLDLTEDPRIRGLAHQNLAIIHGQSGELAEADARLREAYDEFDRADYAWGKAHVLNNTVAVAIERGDFVAAEMQARRAVRLAREVDDLDLLAIATLNLAESLAGLEDWEQAQAEASVALGHFQSSGNVWRRVSCLRILGDMTVRLGDEATAQACWRRGLELAREIGADRDAALLDRRLEGGL
jgi:tetratricopeptide (TPR) repeat protein